MSWGGKAFHIHCTNTTTALYDMSGLIRLPLYSFGHLPRIHPRWDAACQLGPVSVEAAAPAGGEPGEEPRFFLARTVAGAFLLASVALARPLQLDVPHQMSAECGAACLLDM